MSGIPDTAAFGELRLREFPGLADTIYLNSASYGPVPQRAHAAIRAFEERRAAGMLQPADFSGVLDRMRAVAGRLVGGAPDGVALVPNTSVGLNLAAVIVRQRAQRTGAGAPRTVILPDGEFPANVYGWMALEKSGFRMERVPTDADGCPGEDALVERLLQGDVAALAISAVQFSTGWAADLIRLGRACREAGALFVVDAIQAAGVYPLDVEAAHVDVLATGGHKWLCGPFGTGFAWIRPELCREYEPDLPGWLAFESSMDFESLLSYRWDLFPDARRFEVGSLPIQGFVGLAESVEMLLDIGVDTVRSYLSSLQAPIQAWAGRTAGAAAVVTDPRRLAGILSVRVPDATALHAHLTEAGISTVPREGAVRFAPHVFNTPDEMERVVHQLDQWQR